METPVATFSFITFLKNSSYGIAFVVSAGFLGFEPQAGAILITLMIIDVLTGIIRSAAVRGLPSLTSTIGTRGMLSKILTLVSLISLAFAFKGIGYDAKLAVQGIVSVFILSETYSIIGNVHSTITKNPKQEYDALQYLLTFVKNKLEKLSGKS